MFDSDTFTQEMLSNPTKLSSTVLSAMEASDTGRTMTVNDPNNGFVMQCIANCSIFSKFSQKIDGVIASFYPQRAINAEQLYPHLSEFDYVKLMASPATLPFVFAMSSKWLVDNSVYYDENYNRVLIPETSTISMGGTVYSMYHPIEILINRNTGAITAFYDGSSTNSLNVLASNILLDVQQYVRNGISYFQITFNMYQFERKTYKFSVGSDQGFNKKLGYDDQFYAAKVFRLDTNGNWVEFKYSLSKRNYDFQTPTAVLSVLNDKSELNVEIPQIYFDNRQVSQSLKIELYSTKGAVNYSLSLADVKGLTSNFDTKSSKYAVALEQMPSYNLVPAVVEVQGGSDSSTYAEMRDAIVNQRLYDRVATTTPEILEAGQKAGFILTRVIDDLTERMYLASNVLRDSNNMAIPTFSGNILIADDALEGNPSTILNHSDGYYTILPTTTFTISQNGLTCIPMTDGQVATMVAMTNDQLVAELNKGTYVRQPFHITLLTSAKSPQASIYNLLSPSMTSLAFIKENAHSAPQVSVTSCIVNHLENGTGGYQVRLGVGVSSNITDEDPARFNIFLTCLTKSGFFAYLPATYNSTNENGLDLWDVLISTAYHITTDGYITVAMFDEDGILSDVDISLNQTFSVVSSFDRDLDTSVPIDVSLNSLLPADFRLTTVAMMQQEMKLSLGHNLSSQIYCGVNTSWGNDVYKLASETIYHKTDVPIFQLDEQGLINTKYDAVDDDLKIVQIYSAGDTPSDTQDLTLKLTDALPVPASGTTTVINVAKGSGYLKGMAVRGIGIPVNTVVSNISDTTVTLSKKISKAIPAGTTLTFTNPKFLWRTKAAQSAVGVQLTVADTTGLLVGQSVFGFGIAGGSTVKSIDSPTQFSLSTRTLKPVTDNTLLTIINTSAPGVVKIQKGEIVTDVTGKPVIVKGAQNQYSIPAILFDGRIFASDDINDQKIITTISQLLQNYANQISTIDEGLIEDSNVYYKPTRTMGYAIFNTGGGVTVNMPLELWFSVNVYVDASVYNTQTLLSTMEETIISVINDALRNNSFIAISDLTETIKKKLGSNISAVEMGDISGRDKLRVVSLREDGIMPSIENYLVVEADGRIARKPHVEITFLPKPDTAQDTVLASL